MKKIIVLLSVILLLTGCSITKIDDQSIDKIVDTVLEEDNHLYNTVFDGYKYYLPQGIQLVDKDDYNAHLIYKNQNYYLYVDVIGYYHKISPEYDVNKSSYYSKKLQYNDKTGYLEVNEINDHYFVEVMYNYAKIEAYIPKVELNDTIINMCYILSSVQFNDKVLGTLVGDNVLNYQEETFNILEPKRKSGTFLDYVSEYDVYYDTKDEMPDEDKIVADDDE